MSKTPVHWKHRKLQHNIACTVIFYAFTNDDLPSLFRINLNESSKMGPHKNVHMPGQPSFQRSGKFLVLTNSLDTMRLYFFQFSNYFDKVMSRLDFVLSVNSHE